jgi:hypothetical protein
MDFFLVGEWREDLPLFTHPNLYKPLLVLAAYCPSEERGGQQPFSDGFSAVFTVELRCGGLLAPVAPAIEEIALHESGDFLHKLQGNAAHGRTIN